MLLTCFKLFLLLSSSEVSFCLFSAMNFVGKQALIISWFPFYLVIYFWSIIMNRHLAGHMLTIGTTHGSSFMCTGYAPLLGPCLLDGFLGRCSYHRHLSPRPRKHDNNSSLYCIHIQSSIGCGCWFWRNQQTEEGQISSCVVFDFLNFPQIGCCPMLLISHQSIMYVYL